MEFSSAAAKHCINRTLHRVLRVYTEHRRRFLPLQWIATIPVAMCQLEKSID